MESEVFTYYYFYLSVLNFILFFNKVFENFFLKYLQKLEQFNACLNNLSLEAINSINNSKINQFQYNCSSSRSDRSSSRNVFNFFFEKLNNQFLNWINIFKDSECSISDSNEQSYNEVGSCEKDPRWTEFKERQKNFNKYVKQRFVIEFGPIENLTYKKIKRSSFDVMNRIKGKFK